MSNRNHIESLCHIEYASIMEEMSANLISIFVPRLSGRESSPQNVTKTKTILVIK